MRLVVELLLAASVQFNYAQIPRFSKLPTRVTWVLVVTRYTACH